MIQNYTKCERCEHNKVCSYKEIQKDIMNKMEGRLDNICSPDFFKFSFECKEYKNIEIINKNNPFYA